MRRTLLAALLTAIAVTPVQAAPGSVSVPDPAGDWVPSEDVLRITVTSGPLGRGRAVKVTFTLSAAPDPAATYRADLDTGQCDKVWSVAASGLGTSNQTASLRLLQCPPRDTVAPTGPTAPATVTVRGSTIEITAPYAIGLAKGMQIKRISSFVGPVFSGVYVGNGLGQDGFFFSGDLAWRDVTYKLR